MCPLCSDVALDHGWVREGHAVSPALQQHPPRRRQKTLWQALLGAREEEAEPVVSEPILRRLSDDELTLVEAADLFNQSDFRRTVAGVAKSLGEPKVSIVPLAGVNAETVLTFAWDITWYQYRVTPTPRSRCGSPTAATTSPRSSRRTRAGTPASTRPAGSSPTCHRVGAGLTAGTTMETMATATVSGTAADLLERLGVDPVLVSNGDLVVRTPITGEEIGLVARTSEAETAAAVARAVAAFEAWRDVPAPRRGELVRLLGEELRAEKDALGALVTLEVGKIAQEGLGEVQEMIDICDFAVGLSRQLYGRSIASERPGHRLTETWHPLGPVAVISAFNFPVAVWSWNAALALACGDPVIWKPSERTPLTAIATTALLRRAADRFGDVPEGLFELVLGGADRAVQLADDERVVSATGSTAMGKALARGSRRGSGVRSSSSAATTRPSSRRAPTSTSSSAPCCSPPSARPGSDARRCGG